MNPTSMQDLKGDTIVARDGDIGSVKDVYFDDERWAVRYLVVDTGNWLPGRKVLISPASLSARQPGGDAIGVDLTREQVQKAPDVSTDQPVSRLEEMSHASYYGYPGYWTGPYLWGSALTPADYPRRQNRVEEEVRRRAEQQAETSHVRSGQEVIGYEIRAADGEIGHVEDFLIDGQSWAIAGMVVDTRNWLPGRKVVVPPEAIESVDSFAKQVTVRLTREALKGSPEAS